MKGKTKTQKGITLVALIITIVVLLILAVVAVTAIQNDGILGHANNAANAYTQNQLAENTALNEYENFLNKYGTQHTHVFTTSYVSSSIYEHKAISSCECGYTEEKVELHNGLSCNGNNGAGHYISDFACNLCGQWGEGYYECVYDSSVICIYCGAVSEYHSCVVDASWSLAYAVNSYCSWTGTCGVCSRTYGVDDMMVSHSASVPCELCTWDGYTVE